MRSVNPAHKAAFLPGDLVEHNQAEWKYPYVEIIAHEGMDWYLCKYADMQVRFQRKELGKVKGNTRT